MKIPLTDFEIVILNKVVHTHTFGEFNSLRVLLHDLVAEGKEGLISSGQVSERDFPLLQTQVVNNILQFLLRNEFFAMREGEVYFLTERGMNLQMQGSIEKYADWEIIREDKLIKDLHTIEERGYLDEDQTFKKEHVVQPVVVEEQKRKYFGYYILIIIVLIVLAALGKSHKWW